MSIKLRFERLKSSARRKPKAKYKRANVDDKPLALSFMKRTHRAIHLEQLKVTQLESPDEIGRWKKAINKYHYLHNATICGPQILYAISHNRNVVALLSFSICSFHLRDRDEWIGWDEAMRSCRLHLIVQNSRFLIMPGISTKNLASKCLSLCLNRLNNDWQTKYTHPVLAVETFVDKAYPGTSYAADNWIRLGETRGFSRAGGSFYQRNESPKTLWVKELRQDAKQILSALQMPTEFAIYERPGDILSTAKKTRCEVLTNLHEHFKQLPDARRKQGQRYSMASCLSIIAAGFLVGCEGLSECAEFGQSLKPAQLRALGIRPTGKNRILRGPCHNTLWRIMDSIDPGDFEREIAEWYNNEAPNISSAFAIDGKTLCASRDSDGNAQHVISAISHEGSTPFFVKRPRQAKDLKEKEQGI